LPLRDFVAGPFGTRGCAVGTTGNNPRRDLRSAQLQAKGDLDASTQESNAVYYFFIFGNMVKTVRVVLPRMRFAVFTVAAGVAMGMTATMQLLAHQGRWQELRDGAPQMLLAQFVAIMAMLACSWRVMVVDSLKE
jgi:hypothetical protein